MKWEQLNFLMNRIIDYICNAGLINRVWKSESKISEAKHFLIPKGFNLTRGKNAKYNQNPEGVQHADIQLYISCQFVQIRVIRKKNENIIPDSIYFSGDTGKFAGSAQKSGR
jgi:hypothetical protein